MIRLRLATMADAAILRKWRNEARGYFFDSREVSIKAHSKWLSAELTNQQSRMYIIAIAATGLPVGAISLYNLTRLEGEIGRLVIAQHHRRSGYARAAVQAAIGEAKAMGLALVKLSARMDNEPAINLYRGCGFDECGSDVVQSPTGVDIAVTHMERRL